MTAGPDTAPATVERAGDHVACVTLRRPPHSYFDVPMVRRLAGGVAATAERRTPRFTGR